MRYFSIPVLKNLSMQKLITLKNKEKTHFISSQRDFGKLKLKKKQSLVTCLSPGMELSTFLIVWLPSSLSAVTTLSSTSSTFFLTAFTKACYQKKNGFCFLILISKLKKQNNYIYIYIHTVWGIYGPRW